MRSIPGSILRILQVVMVFLSTALVGNVIAKAGKEANEEATVNFLAFCCAIAWLSTIYGLVTNFTSLDIPIAEIAMDGAATLFTFIGAVVISAKLGPQDCGKVGKTDKSYIAHDDESRCRELQASTVFLWVLFAAFSATSFFAFREFKRGGSIMSRPSMSQIGV